MGFGLLRVALKRKHVLIKQHSAPFFLFGARQEDDQHFSGRSLSDDRLVLMSAESQHRAAEDSQSQSVIKGNRVNHLN